MINGNGKIYCDRPQCCLEITRYQRSIRVLKPDGDSENPDHYLHFHDREGYWQDCARRTLEETEARAKTKRPSARDMSDFEKYLAQEQAKRAIRVVQ